MILNGIFLTDNRFFRPEELFAIIEAVPMICQCFVENYEALGYSEDDIRGIKRLTKRFFSSLPGDGKYIRRRNRRRTSRPALPLDEVPKRDQVP